jgi:Spy/CpxP family protein refolding chaperone
MARRDVGMFEREQVELMSSFVKGRMFRAAAVLLCSAGLAVSAAVAQQDTTPPGGQQQGAQMQGGSRGMNPDRRAMMMQQRLDLSADQTAQVRQILTASMGKMEALRSNTALAPEDMRAQMMALRQGEQAKIRALLTPDQQAKFDAMQARMQQRQRGGEGGAPQGAPDQSQQPQL